MRRLRLRRLGKLRPPRRPLSDLRASGQRFLANRPARQFLDELRGRVARRIHRHDEDVVPAA
jgi:hypothetical protein